MVPDMKRYWVVTPSTRQPHHYYNGAVVLAPESGPIDRAYLMDLTVENTSFQIDRRYLARWHSYTAGHDHCYCQRQRKEA